MINSELIDRDRIMGIPKPRGFTEVHRRSVTVRIVCPKKEEMILMGSKDAPSIEGDDRPAILSGKRGDDKSDDL